MKKTTYPNGLKKVLLITILLLSLNQVVNFAVTQPNPGSQPSRFILFAFLKVFSGISLNLVTLYLGFTAGFRKRSFSQINKLFFAFVFVGLSVILFSLVKFQNFAFNDVWLLLFPISHNDFTYAASVLPLYLFGYKIDERLQMVPNEKKKALLFFLLIFCLGSPFLFDQGIWGIISSDSFIWVIFLFLCGIFLKQLNLKINKNTAGLLFIFSFLIISLAIFFSEPNLASSTIQNRWLAPTSVFIFIISIEIFMKFKKDSKAFNVVSLNNLKWIIFFVYFMTEMPIIKFLCKYKLHIKYNDTGASWLLNIIFYTFVFIVLAAALLLLIKQICKLKSVKKILRLTEIKSIDSLVNTPYFLKKTFKNNWHILLVFVTLWVMAFIQIFVARFYYYGFSKNIFKTILQVSSQPILLNILIGLLFFFLMLGLINKFWYAYFITFFVFVIIGVSEFLKISLREEPILPSDLSMLTAINELLSMINPILIVILLVSIVFFAAISIVLQKKLDSKTRKKVWYLRISMIVIPLVFFSGVFTLNHKNSFSRIIFNSFKVQTSFENQLYGASINGPIVQFLNNVDIRIMDKPNGYSKQKVESIMSKYNKRAELINKTRSNTLKNQTIIFNLSESFSDPNRVPNLKVSPNPISNIIQLKRKTTSGLMLSNGYGGGTADMEWQSLTGMALSNLSATLSTPYTQLVPKQNVSPAFTDMFTVKYAIHPFTASLYNRKAVFKKYGFNKFFFIGSKNKILNRQKIGRNPYISDESAYKDTLKLIQSDNNGSKFIQLSTMQNHMPYKSYYSGKKFKLNGTAVNSSNKGAAQTYVQGLNYTDKAFSKFIANLNTIHKPVTVVWYGDHLASIWGSKMMKQYGIKLHQTDFLIYNNKSKKVISKNELVGPYEFPALVLKNDNIKVSPYYALVTDVSDKLPPMTSDPNSTVVNSVNGSNVFISKKGKKIKLKNLKNSQKRIFEDYKMIEYDLTAGKQYSAKWAQEKLPTK